MRRTSCCMVLRPAVPLQSCNCFPFGRLSPFLKRFTQALCKNIPTKAAMQGIILRTPKRQVGLPQHPPHIRQGDPLPQDHAPKSQWKVPFGSDIFPLLALVCFHAQFASFCLVRQFSLLPQKAPSPPTDVDTIFEMDTFLLLYERRGEDDHPSPSPYRKIKNSPSAPTVYLIMKMSAHSPRRPRRRTRRRAQQNEC